MTSRNTTRLALAGMTSALALAAMPGAALAQDNETEESADERGVGSIIVTAQRRE